MANEYIDAAQQINVFTCINDHITADINIDSVKQRVDLNTL